MGWFDNEQEADGVKSATPQTQPRPVARPPAPGAETGSTLGPQIHVEGTIVCDEDLTIVGRVDGTIRAHGTLVVAQDADVRAKIDGRRVLVHGKVDGNVHGAERVALGQTARLTGNIEAPALEIAEGAYFKGSVEMQSEKPAKAGAAGKSATKGTPEGSEKAGGADEGKSAATEESKAGSGSAAKAGAAAVEKGGAAPQQTTS